MSYAICKQATQSAGHSPNLNCQKNTSNALLKPGQLTLDMKSPKAPPSTPPIAPAIMDLARHDSIAPDIIFTIFCSCSFIPAVLPALPAPGPPYIPGKDIVIERQGILRRAPAVERKERRRRRQQWMRREMCCDGEEISERNQPGTLRTNGRLRLAESRKMFTCLQPRRYKAEQLQNYFRLSLVLVYMYFLTFLD